MASDSFILGVLLTGVIFAISTLSILIFVRKTHPKKNPNYMFLLILIWTIYVGLHLIASPVTLFIGQIASFTAILTYVLLLPKLVKIYNKPLLVTAGLIALLSAALDITQHYFIRTIPESHHLLLVTPIFFGYLLYMEAAIRRMK